MKINRFYKTHPKRKFLPIIEQKTTIIIIIIDLITTRYLHTHTHTDKYIFHILIIIIIIKLVTKFELFFVVAINDGCSKVNLKHCTS